jgi:hypothetical protein
MNKFMSMRNVLLSRGCGVRNERISSSRDIQTTLIFLRNVKKLEYIPDFIKIKKSLLLIEHQECYVKLNFL